VHWRTIRTTTMRVIAQRSDLPLQSGVPYFLAPPYERHPTLLGLPASKFGLFNADVRESACRQNRLQISLSAAKAC